MSSDLLDLVRELNALNDDNLAERVIKDNDVQWCLSELQDILEAGTTTLTPQNEPLTCAGCYYLDEQCAPCAYCIRSAGYADYYRRPPEGEEDT